MSEYLIMKQPARLEMDNISVGYNGQTILQDLSVQVPHGGQVAVVGPNGAGKSTLFKALVGLLPLRGGRIIIHGEPLGHHKDCVAYVPQREDVDWRFPVSVAEVVMMGRFGKLGWTRRPSKQDRVAVQRALDQMNIAELAQRSIGDLSGGQQQRVFLARALAQEPHILLMDEPFTGVDAATQEVTLDLLDELKNRGVTTMVSTHDLSMAAQRFETVLLLNKKLVAYGPPEQALSTEAIQRAFGGQVLFLNGVAAIVDDCCSGGDQPHGTHHHGEHVHGESVPGERRQAEGR